MEEDGRAEIAGADARARARNPAAFARLSLFASRGRSVAGGPSPRRALRPRPLHPRRARTPSAATRPLPQPPPPRRGRRVLGWVLPDLVVRSFLGDGHIVRVALAEPCGGDADEAGLAAEVL